MAEIKFTEEELEAIKLGDEGRVALRFLENFLQEAWDGCVDDIADSQEDEKEVRERAAMKMKLIKGFKMYLWDLVNRADALSEIKEDEKATSEEEPF